MFTASITRALTSLNPSCPPIPTLKSKSPKHKSKKTSKSKKGSKSTSIKEKKSTKKKKTNENQKENVIPIPQNYTDVLQFNLDNAQLKCTFFIQTLNKLYDQPQHPAMLLKVQAIEIQLHEWQQRVNCLEQKIIQSQYYSIPQSTSFAETGFVSIQSIEDSRKCSYCGELNSIRIDASKNEQQCLACHVKDVCFDVSYTIGEKPATSKQNHYNPGTHWAEALNYAQAMRTSGYPKDIISKLEHVIENKYRIERSKWHLIKLKFINNVLKKDLKYKDRYKHRVLFWCIITKNEPVRMTNDEYQKIYPMFFVYLQHIHDVIKELGIDRRNLLSYDYLGYQFNRIQAETDPRFIRHMKWFSLLSDDKLPGQDEIFAPVCERAGWPFFPTV